MKKVKPSTTAAKNDFIFYFPLSLYFTNYLELFAEYAELSKTIPNSNEQCKASD